MYSNITSILPPWIASTNSYIPIVYFNSSFANISCYFQDQLRVTTSMNIRNVFVLKTFSIAKSSHFHFDSDSDTTIISFWIVIMEQCLRINIYPTFPEQSEWHLRQIKVEIIIQDQTFILTTQFHCVKLNSRFISHPIIRLTIIIIFRCMEFMKIPKHIQFTRKVYFMCLTNGYDLIYLGQKLHNFFFSQCYIHVDVRL